MTDSISPIFFIFEKENIRASDEENDSSAVDQLKTSIFWWDEKVQKSISNVKIFRDKKSLEQTKYFDFVSFPWKPILSNEFTNHTFWSCGLAQSLSMNKSVIILGSSGHGYFRNANKHRLTLYFSLWCFEIAERSSWLGLYLRKTEAWIHGPEFRPSLENAIVWKLHDSSSNEFQMTSNLTRKENRNRRFVHQIIELVIFVSTRL